MKMFDWNRSNDLGFASDENLLKALFEKLLFFLKTLDKTDENIYNFFFFQNA